MPCVGMCGIVTRYKGRSRIRPPRVQSYRLVIATLTLPIFGGVSSSCSLDLRTPLDTEPNGGCIIYLTTTV